MSRSTAREVAMMMIYSQMMGGEDTPTQVCEKVDGIDALTKDESRFAEELATGVLSHTEMLDGRIGAHAVGWSVDRIARVDLAILRLAVYEMFCRDDVPTGAAINEAVELSKRFGGDDKSASFVNGILGAIAREADGAPADGE